MTGAAHSDNATPDGASAATTVTVADPPSGTGFGDTEPPTVGAVWSTWRFNVPGALVLVPSEAVQDRAWTPSPSTTDAEAEAVLRTSTPLAVHVTFVTATLSVADTFTFTPSVPDDAALYQPEEATTSLGSTVTVSTGGSVSGSGTKDQSQTVPMSLLAAARSSEPSPSNRPSATDSRWPVMTRWRRSKRPKPSLNSTMIEFGSSSHCSAVTMSKSPSSSTSPSAIEFGLGPKPSIEKSVNVPLPALARISRKWQSRVAAGADEKIQVAVAVHVGEIQPRRNDADHHEREKAKVPLPSPNNRAISPSPARVTAMSP